MGASNTTPLHPEFVFLQSIPDVTTMEAIITSFHNNHPTNFTSRDVHNLFNDYISNEEADADAFLGRFKSSNNSSTVNAYVILATAIIVASTKPEDKITLLFKLFTFGNKQTTKLTEINLNTLLICALRGVLTAYDTSAALDPSKVEELVKIIFARNNNSPSKETITAFFAPPDESVTIASLLTRFE